MFRRSSRSPGRLAGLVSACMVLWLLSAGVAHGQGFASALAALLGEGKPGSLLSVEGTQIHARRGIGRLYELNGMRPLWSAAAVRSLAAAIDGLEGDGLTPDDYRFPAIAAVLSGAGLADLSDGERARAEVLLSEALIRAVYNLYVGKVDAEHHDANINFARPIEAHDSSSLLLDAIETGEIENLFERARPQSIYYDRLRAALKRYRGYAAAGGWPFVPEGPTLKPDESDPRVALLRERLRVTGDFSGPTPADPNRYDSDLLAAVERFQARHRLQVDGAVGPATLAALNVPVERRINQIRVNLERQRWLLHEVYDEFLVVDIAAFQVYWVKDNEVIWQEPAQVGRAYTQTPLFKDTISYLEFNPTWTIPPGILRRSILPALKKNPNYLDEKGYHLLTQDGKRVDPKTVDWQSMRRIPYIVRQPPGPDNALGLVKFMFPNKHFVFLHDTNRRDLFDRSGRAFSSGCVRVRNPFDLAERLLAGQGDWDRAKIDRVVASGRQTRVNLERPLRIIIAYFTAQASADTVFFNTDIYARDEDVLSALDGDFRLRNRDRRN